MTWGQRKSQRQDPDASGWIARDAIVRGLDHPFEPRLNPILDEAGIDRRVEVPCKRFYVKARRPGIGPGEYLPMLMIGYVEGLDSARGIALALGAKDRTRWDASLSLADCSATKLGRASE